MHDIMLIIIIKIKINTLFILLFIPSPLLLVLTWEQCLWILYKEYTYIILSENELQTVHLYTTYMSCIVNVRNINKRLKRVSDVMSAYLLHHRSSICLEKLKLFFFLAFFSRNIVIRFGFSYSAYNSTALLSCRKHALHPFNFRERFSRCVYIVSLKWITLLSKWNKRGLPMQYSYYFQLKRESLGCLVCRKQKLYYQWLVFVAQWNEPRASLGRIPRYNIWRDMAIYFYFGLSIRTFVVTFYIRCQIFDNIRLVSDHKDTSHPPS